MIKEISLDIKEIKFHRHIVIRDFNYIFKSGNIYFLNGESGTGKTTLFNILSFLTSNYKGEIRYDNNSFIKSKFKYFDQISYFDVDSNLISELTVYESLCLVNNNEELIDSILNYFNMMDIKYKKTKLLSKGEKDRVKILKIILEDKPVMILDEPFSSLDVKNVDIFMKYFTSIKSNKIIIISTHKIDTLKYDGTTLLLKDTYISIIGSNKLVIKNDSQFNFNKQTPNYNIINLRLLFCELIWVLFMAIFISAIIFFALVFINLNANEYFGQLTEFGPYILGVIIGFFVAFYFLAFGLYMYLQRRITGYISTIRSYQTQYVLLSCSYFNVSVLVSFIIGLLLPKLCEVEINNIVLDIFKIEYEGVVLFEYNLVFLWIFIPLLIVLIGYNLANVFYKYRSK